MIFKASARGLFFVQHEKKTTRNTDGFSPKILLNQDSFSTSVERPAPPPTSLSPVISPPSVSGVVTLSGV
jgi:hypothetical protein